MKNNKEIWDPLSEFETKVLPNGLTIHVVHWPEWRWESMGFLVHIGAEHDPPGREGLAHFTEHLISKNTILPKKEIVSFFKHHDRTVKLGNVYYPSTCFKFLVPADENILSYALSIFGPMLLTVRFRPDSIEQERNVMASDFYENYPFPFFFDLKMRERRCLYNKHRWLGRMASPLGHPRSIAKISQQDIQLFYDSHYVPKNITVVAVGGLTVQRLTEIVSASPLGAVDKQGEKTPCPIPVSSVDYPSENRYIFKISKYISSVFEVGDYRSVAAIPGTINHFAIKFLCEALSELLKDEIREKRGWSYKAKSSFDDYGDIYQFSIESGMVPPIALDEIESIVNHCIVSVAEREELLTEAKETCLRNNLRSEFTAEQVCDKALMSLSKKQRILPLEEIIRDMERIKPSDIQQVVLKWLQPERRWTLIARP